MSNERLTVKMCVVRVWANTVRIAEHRVMWSSVMLYDIHKTNVRRNRLSSSFRRQDGSNRVIRNIGKFLPDYTASYSRRQCSLVSVVRTSIFISIHIQGYSGRR